MLMIDNLLPPDLCDTLAAVLGTAEFVDGRASAGWTASPVKKNEQAAFDLAVEECRERVQTALLGHETFQIFAFPKHIIGPAFARYRPGDHYGAHTDDAIMGGVRTDISFTIFLSDPQSYDGGELVIETAAGVDTVKAARGSLFAYPAVTLHRVAPVTRGERLVAIGWVRSYVRAAEAREILFDLERVRLSVHAKSGKTADLDLLSKCYANLMRMWCSD